MALWPNNFTDIRGRFPVDLQGSAPFLLVQQRTNRNLAYFANQNIVKYSSIPQGMIGSGVTILQPLVGGGMAMRATASGDLSADLYPSRSMAIDMTGSGNLDATAGLVVSMLAAFSGSGTLAATIQGRLNASADFTGTSSFTAAMSGVASLAADLLGDGDLEATIAAYGNMEIDIVVTGTGLSTANVGQAVWAALASTNNDAGTMGEKLNDAGSASNPWTEVIESGYTAAEILRIIAASTAGKTTGAGTASMTFTGLDGSTERITGTMDEDGNRTAVTVDGA